MHGKCNTFHVYMQVSPSELSSLVCTGHALRANECYGISDTLSYCNTSSGGTHAHGAMHDARARSCHTFIPCERYAVRHPLLMVIQNFTTLQYIVGHSHGTLGLYWSALAAGRTHGGRILTHYHCTWEIMPRDLVCYASCHHFFLLQEGFEGHSVCAGTRAITQVNRGGGSGVVCWAMPTVRMVFRVNTDTACHLAPHPPCTSTA